MTNAITMIDELGPVLQHLPADPGLARRHRVVVLGLAVDAEQAGVAADPRTTTSSGRHRRSAHPEVDVGQPAGQLVHTPGPPRQAGEAVQRRSLVGHPSRQSAVSLSSNASRTASSIVCFGPVNQCFAEIVHQIVEQEQRTERDDRGVVDELPLELRR